MFNKYASGIKVEILSSGQKETLESSFEVFVGSHPNCYILDIKVTECEGQYTMWIFYEE